MNGTSDDSTKGSKSERETQIPYDITYIQRCVFWLLGVSWNQDVGTFLGCKVGFIFSE